MEESFRSIVAETVRAVMREEFSSMRLAMTPAPTVEEPLISVARAAVLVDLDQRTIYDMVRAELVPNHSTATRSVRIKESELRAALRLKKAAKPATEAADLDAEELAQRILRKRK